MLLIHVTLKGSTTLKTKVTKKLLNIDHQQTNHLVRNKKRRKWTGKSKIEQVLAAAANVTDQINNSNVAGSKSHTSLYCNRTCEKNTGAKTTNSGKNKR